MLSPNVLMVTRLWEGGAPIEGTEFTRRESYPTSQSTWECVFDSTRSCGEGSPVWLRSEDRAMCAGIARAN